MAKVQSALRVTCQRLQPPTGIIRQRDRRMLVHIYRPSANAMQSAPGSQPWVLEYVLESARRPDPLMGWTSAADTNNQVQLRFSSREQATTFAQRNGWQYTIQPERIRRSRPVNYADNFLTGRVRD